LELASNPAPERTLLDLIRAPFVIFRRALERGNYLVVAEATAEELPQLSLIDALELTLLVAREGPAPLLTALLRASLSVPTPDERCSLAIAIRAADRDTDHWCIRFRHAATFA
jgi:hypothetical protein